MAETRDVPRDDAPGPRPGVDRDNLRNFERLHRSVTDRKVAGVAGGLGQHLNVDPTVLRVLFVVLCFFGLAGLLLYGAAWLLVPEEGRSTGTVAASPGARNVVLIAVAAAAALLLLGHSRGGFGFPWPAVVGVLGVLVWLLLRDRRPAAGPPTAEQTGGSEGSSGTSPPPPPWSSAPPPPSPSAPPPPAAPAPRRRRSGPLLFGPTLALLAVSLGALGLYDVFGGSVVPAAYPALALALVGAMLVLGAVVGRPGGLVLLGLVAALALAVTSAVGAVHPRDLRNDHLTVSPTAAALVHDSYGVRSGHVVVDLSDVRDPQALAGRDVEVHGTVAEVVVVLPRGVRTRVRADISGPGQVDLPDNSSGGFGTTLSGVYGSGAGSSDLTVDAHLSIGHIDVRTSR